MRLNKYISSMGICSRREADRLIEDGKVRVNGKIPSIGYRVEENDIVEVSGRILKNKPKLVYIALNKPVGIISTTERNIKNNIIDFVNYPERIFPIGRLDKPSEGLILLTNDGDIINEILREENNHKKEYIVKVNKKITDEFLNNMRNGVKIYNPVRDEYTITKKTRVEKLSNRKFKIVLSQGLNRQIRRMCAKLGYEVEELKRIKIMNIELGNLPVGEWRYLNKMEMEYIKKLKGNES